MRKIKVTVPATSANLGPGYDCMGLALDLYSEFYFEERGEPFEDGLKFSLEGCPEEFQNEENLTVKAFKKAYEAFRIKNKAEKGNNPSLPCLLIRINSSIPVARGLGSSAACITAGLLAADFFLGGPFSKDELFALCSEMEGHPDNAAPCIFGGLAASFTEEKKPHHAAFDCGRDWKFVTVIPDYEVRTEEARKVVKKDISLADGVYSVSHALCMAKALETSDPRLLKYACRDVLHEPYRKDLIKDYGRVKDLSLANGADAFFISGSGSTMVALTLSPQTAEKIKSAVLREFPNFCVKLLCASEKGGTVEEY